MPFNLHVRFCCRSVASAVLIGTSVPPVFEAVQPELFVAGGAFANAWADFDNDGDLDLFVGFGGTPANRLYRNDDGVFVDVAGAAGLADARATRAAAWGDMDRDGDPDLLVGFTPGGGSVLRLYRNDAGRFAEITAAAGLGLEAGAVRPPSGIDLHGDGDLDLFVAFRDREHALPEHRRQVRRCCSGAWSGRFAPQRGRRLVRLRRGRYLISMLETWTVMRMGSSGTAATSS